MKLLLNDELNNHSVQGVFDSIAYLSSRSDSYGRIEGAGFYGSFYLKKYFNFFHVLTFTSFHFEAKANIDEVKNEFLNVIKNKLPCVDIIFQGQSSALFPFVPVGAQSMPFGTYLISLEKSAEILFKEIHEKHRNVIRSAEKKEVQIFCDNLDLQNGYELIRQVYENQGLSFYSLEYFENLKSKLGDQFNIWTAKDQNSIILAVAFILSDSTCAYYLQGGTKKGAINGAANLLHWKAMLHYKSQGIKFYDFLGARIHVASGSKLEGIQKFKERFGGALIQGYLWKYSIHHFKFQMFYFLLRLKSLLSGNGYFADTIDQESKKWQ